jgi:hypothetical protein
MGRATGWCRSPGTHRSELGRAAARFGAPDQPPRLRLRGSDGALLVWIASPLAPCARQRSFLLGRLRPALSRSAPRRPRLLMRCPILTAPVPVVPQGLRNRLSSKLISDLSDIWHDNGPEILRKMAMREPVQLARMAYATLPRDILVSVEQRIPGGLSAEDWMLLQPGPDQGCHSPGQQFAAGRSLRRDRNRAARTFRARDSSRG